MSESRPNRALSMLAIRGITAPVLSVNVGIRGQNTMIVCGLSLEKKVGVPI